MRTRSVGLGALAMLVGVACGGSGGSGSGDGAEVEPAALVGETDQGLRLRIDPVGDHEVSLRFPANCGDDDRREGTAVSLHRRRFEAEVDGDGSFSVDESYVEEGTDGDEEHVEVRIDGRFADDGAATGTLEASVRWWNGQGQSFSDPCATGSVAWTADRPPVEGHNVVVASADEISLATAGDDLVAASGSELMRVDAATGEARHVGLGGPAGSATTADPNDPNAPPTVVAGGAAPAAPIWLQQLAVVADGVWMVDPASRVVSRFELADGARTATITDPLDHMAAGPDALWTVSTNIWASGYALDRRDPVTGAVLMSTPVERGVTATGPTDVWYVDATLAGGRLRRVDPTTLALGEPFEVDIPLYGHTPVATQDRVWWLDSERLMSIELAGGQVAPVDLPSIPVAVAGDATGVWVVHEQEAVARRIEAGRVVRTVDIPDGWWDLVVGAGGTVWLAGRDGVGGAPGIVRLDPAVTAG